MRRLIEKVISTNMCYYIGEVTIGGKVLYTIKESINNTYGRFREYDLNLYYSDYSDAIKKLDSL